MSVLLVPLSRRRRAEALLAAARLNCLWEGPPSAEAIRKLDAERLVADPLLTEEASEEDLGLARTLLAERSPEQIAAALVRVYRARLPAPEDVYDPGAGRDQRPVRDKGDAGRRERPPRQADRGEAPPAAARTGRSIWFRLDIGRRNEADPRWLLPMICRRGKITKADIGAIRIFDKETKFEVAEGAADRMIAASKQNGSEEIRIELLGVDGNPGGSKPFRPSPPPTGAGGERPHKSRRLRP